MSEFEFTIPVPPELTPWTLEQRLEIARRHMMQAARTADIRGLPAAHWSILAAVDALDDALEAVR